MENLNALNNELSEALLASGRLRDLLEELGCEPRGYPGGQKLRGRCPVHSGDDLNFMVGTEGRGLPIYWACHSHRCHKAKKLKPTLLGLVRGALAGDADRPGTVSEAVAFIQKFLDPDRTPPRPRPGPTARVIREPSPWSRSQVRQRLEIPSPYFLSRGFSPDVLDRFDVGESAVQNRAVVPIYENDRYVGFISRSTKPHCGSCGKCHEPDGCGSGEPRWMFPPNFPKGEYLFNYAEALKSQAPFILLTEGAPDVLRAAEAGVVAVCGFGTDLTNVQAIKLSGLNKPVLVAFDNDDAGLPAAQAVARQLREGRTRVEVRHPPKEYKDVGEMTATEVAQWLAI
jgi:hypothetical protein